MAGATLPRSAAAADPSTVEWSEDWPRVRPWEAVNAVVLTIADTLIESQVSVPSSPNWRGGILFDDWARATFRGHTSSVQSTASTVSDILYEGGTLAPFVVDVYLTALSIQKNADVALQMFLIDMQSLSLAGVISLGAEHSVGRARPYTDRCGANGDVRDGSGHLLQVCDGPNDNRSFFSGHVTSVATMAGLTCLHHQHLPLYGGGAADLAPCLVMIGAALGTGVLRLVYDEHWASDVVVAWGVGAAVGYLLPAALHYGFGGGRAPGVLRGGDAYLAPMIRPYPGGLGLGVAGAF